MLKIRGLPDDAADDALVSLAVLIVAVRWLHFVRLQYILYPLWALSMTLLAAQALAGGIALAPSQLGALVAPLATGGLVGCALCFLYVGHIRRHPVAEAVPSLPWHGLLPRRGCLERLLWFSGGAAAQIAVGDAVERVLGEQERGVTTRTHLRILGTIIIGSAALLAPVLGAIALGEWTCGPAIPDLLAAVSMAVLCTEMASFVACWAVVIPERVKHEYGVDLRQIRIDSDETQIWP